MDMHQAIDVALDNLSASLGERNRQLEKELAIARTNLQIKDAHIADLEKENKELKSAEESSSK